MDGYDFKGWGYPDQIFTTFAFVAFMCCAIPFPWHLEAWNTGTCLYMAWVGWANLFLAIHSIVWRNYAIDWAPIYCDIFTKLWMGFAIAVPAASLCINRRLYHIASVRTVTNSKADRRRAVFVDLAIGLGIPILYMALHYIPQGHRYNIYEGVGCWPFTYMTTVGVVIVYVPPILVGLASGTYAILAIRCFAKTRSQFNEFLSSKGYRNLTASRYLRLMALAATDVLLTCPSAIYQLVVNCQSNGVRPWKGWAETHARFNRADVIPKIIWQHWKHFVIPIETTRWSAVLCALIFFAYFGFADEAFKNYRSVLRTVSRTVGISIRTESDDTFSAAGSKGFGSSSGLPSFVRRGGPKRAGSIGSFSSAGDEKDGSKKEKEKGGFNPDISFGALSLADVGGALSSVSGSTSTLASPVSDLPSPPPTAVTRPQSGIDMVDRESSAAFLTISQPPRPTSPTRPTPDHLEKTNTVDMV